MTEEESTERSQLLGTCLFSYSWVFLINSKIFCPESVSSNLLVHGVTVEPDMYKATTIYLSSFPNNLGRMILSFQSLSLSCQWTKNLLCGRTLDLTDY